MTNTKEIKIPDIGDFDTVDVIEILVSPGDTIQAEDPLITLESDKATMEIPSPEAGTVKEIKIAVGDKVSEDSVILILESNESQATELPQENSVKTDSIATIKEITVPDIGDFDSVDVIEVLVAPGDQLNAEDSLITLESDKATMDIPAPEPGTVKQVNVSVGNKVAQGDVILLLESHAQQTIPVKDDINSPPESNTIDQPKVQEPTKPTTTPPTRQTQTVQIDETGFQKAHASPSVRKFARELGVDLSKVNGSGRKNRILKEDIKAYVKKILTSGASPGIYVAELPEVDFKKFGDIDVQPLTKINKLTGKFLHRSWFYVPHVTQFDEADITDLDRLRKEMSESYKEQGIKITFLAFLIKAVTHTLKEFPRFNASLDNKQENLILKKYTHIGVAVDTPDGLVVPVLRDTDKKPLVELAQEISEIAVRAREKKITPAEMQGACFTISSLGGIGGTAFTPIVNQPEVAILGVSKASIKPIYINNELQPRKILPLSLSYDHRVIDGVAAARFTTYLASTLADSKQLAN